jgi:hypothetical protein
MFDVDVFLGLLDDIEERKRRRMPGSPALQQGARLAGVSAVRKARQRPGPKPKRRGGEGRPYTGGKPRTGSIPVPIDVEEEWRSRPDAGGRGGPVSSRGAISLHDAKPGSNSSHGANGNSPPRIAGPAERLAVAGGSQPAVVKLVSFAAGSARVGKLLGYQSRDGELAVERETGEQMTGGSWIQTLADEWSEEGGRQPSKDVLRLALSVQAESDEAIGAALRQALPGHRIAWRSEPTANEEGRVVDVVMSAAARTLPGDPKAPRIYDNRRSLRALEAKLEVAFGSSIAMDVYGFAHGVEGVGRYLAQIRGGGRHALHVTRLDRSGPFIADAILDAGGSTLDEAKGWKRDLRSQERRDVAHIIFSAKPGTPREQFVDAARATLAREFAGHRYALVLHEDRQHLHVHAAVKMLSETGERLHPRIQDFTRWRKTLAEEARERNIAMDAMSRFERANPPGYKLKDIRRVQRGVASETARRRVEAVKTGAVHVPTRDEGKARVVAAANGWSQIASVASQTVQQIQVEPGVLRLYRAERPGTRSSTPIFTRDRTEAVELAQRYGGTLSYIDIRPNEMHQIAPARRQSDMKNGDRFVVARQLADRMRPLPADLSETASVLHFNQRCQTAVHSMGQMAGIHYPPNPQAGSATQEIDDMANLHVMKTSFAEMDGQMQVIKKHLPAERLSEIEELHGKLKQTQQEMLATQESIERKRGTVEGESFVAPVKHAFNQFVAEERGEIIRYVSRKDNGQIGAIAFTDHGDKVEIAQWKDREAVLAAMQLAAQKWGALTINGTESYKAIAVDLAAEHGFKITNPELQDKLAAARERMSTERAGRAGIAPGLASEDTKAGAQAEAVVPASMGLASGETVPPIVDGDKVRPADRDRASMLAAMREASKKWDTITVNGSERDKALAVELAAEHGFKISNPELQDKLVAAQEKVEQRRQKEQAREDKRAGFTEGAASQGPGQKTDAEIELALQTVRERTDEEAQREVRQADRSAATSERPIDGGGEDHAYRTQAEAQAAVRAERVVDQNPSTPIPADVNQSPQIERQRQIQQGLLKEKEANHQAETQKQKPKPRQK